MLPEWKRNASLFYVFTILFQSISSDNWFQNRRTGLWILMDSVWSMKLHGEISFNVLFHFIVTVLSEYCITELTASLRDRNEIRLEFMKGWIGVMIEQDCFDSQYWTHYFYQLLLHSLFISLRFDYSRIWISLFRNEIINSNQYHLNDMMWFSGKSSSVVMFHS